jgi:NAD(P)-dependent dehydrogenase (short-subunit alcohol dehydrogenase family)
MTVKSGSTGSERVAIVTGPTSGIGTVIARNLAGQGMHVVLAARDADKARALQPEIGGTTTVLTLDTSSQQSIRDFAESFKSRFDRLDVLVNNAGIQQKSRRMSVDGIELVFATNVLGYHLLTRELQAVLVASAPARVVNLASTFAGGLDLDDLQFERRPYNDIACYKQSKQANRLLSWAWARRFNAAGVMVNACSPGLVNTGLYREMQGFQRLFMRGLSLLVGVSVERGADTPTWLASDEAILGVTGKFFEKRHQQPCRFANEATEEALFTRCEALLARSGPA